MDLQSLARSTRLPRFHRAPEPPRFQITESDIDIVRLLARHRFLRSTHIAALVGRSLDRTNDRLSKLFHAGYVDRPRAQLDYYPRGSAPIVYALANRGARLLIERDGIDFPKVEWSRKNRSAGRPFIDHQLEIMDFYVALQCAMRDRSDIRLIRPTEMTATFPDQSFDPGRPFALRAAVRSKGAQRVVRVIPDLAFGIQLPDGSRRCFMVEIDRGTMPISRSDFGQTSFEQKMRAYLHAHAAKEHQRQFGWRTFRVLTITSEPQRLHTMLDALRMVRPASSPGRSLFFFTTRRDLLASDPLSHAWRDGLGRDVRLI